MLLFHFIPSYPSGSTEDDKAIAELGKQNKDSATTIDYYPLQRTSSRPEQTDQEQIPGE